VAAKKAADPSSTANQTQDFTGCGTQCLGDVTTNRIKPMPGMAREVFLFAVNGINILLFAIGLCQMATSKALLLKEKITI
jgi:hypothetical protein